MDWMNFNTVRLFIMLILTELDAGKVLGLYLVRTVDELLAED